MSGGTADGIPAGLRFHIEGFTDLTPIGSGGFGHVYRAHQPALDRAVAIKVLVLAAMDDRTRARFDRERRTMGALSVHPAIVTLYESGITSEGFPYLVMELMQGGSLAERVHLAGPLPWPEAAQIMARVSDAVHHAHGSGVLHRDIKPENVLMSEFGEAKLTDFGIAALLDATATATSNLTTTVEHAAPEILDGLKPTPATDVYSLGSTLFALLSGHSPFRREDNDSFVALLARIATEPVPDLRSRGLPDDAAGIIEAALEKDPLRRVSSAAEFAARLRNATGSEQPDAAMTVGRPRPVQTEVAPPAATAAGPASAEPSTLAQTATAGLPPEEPVAAPSADSDGAAVPAGGLWLLGALALMAPFLGWLTSFGSPPTQYWGGAFDVDWTVVWTGRILADGWWASWGVPMFTLAIITAWAVPKRPRLFRPIGITWLTMVGVFVWVVETNVEALRDYPSSPIGYVVNLPSGAWVAALIGLVLVAGAGPMVRVGVAAGGLAAAGLVTHLSEVRVAWLVGGDAYYGGWWQSLGAFAFVIAAVVAAAYLGRAAKVVYIVALLASGAAVLYAVRLGFELPDYVDTGAAARIALLWNAGAVLMLTAGLLVVVAPPTVRSRQPA